MPSVSLFSGIFCRGEEVARRLAGSQGYELIDDQALITGASQRFQQSTRRFECVLAGGESPFERLSHRKGNAMTCLKQVLADILLKDRAVLLGFAGHLIPRNVTHVLRVCLIAEKGFRIREALEDKGLSERAALKAVRKEDKRAAVWTHFLFQKDPWDSELYDMVLPIDKKGVDGTVAFIEENLEKDILRPTPESRRAVEDLRLSAEVEMALGKKGEGVSVTVAKGRASLTINKHVLLLSRFEAELKRLALTVSGVREVETFVGPGFHKSNIYRNHDLRMPSRILLVDDERELVETLSERLLMRDIDTTVVYDGREALDLVEKDEPEVMVLDLKMPGINGFEVLRRIKKDHPHVEVIVLTGHGSREDEETCLKLGAFAYLKKPVDIEMLAKTMREAYGKVRKRRMDENSGG